MENKRLQGNFLEQFVTEEDKKDAENKALDQLRGEVLREENKQLADGLNRELDRLFHETNRFSLSAGSRNVTVSVSLRDLTKAFPSLNIKSIRPYDSQFNQGEIDVMWPDKPEILNIHGKSHTATVTLNIQINDADFDERLAMVFKLAKALRTLKPMIRGQV